MAIIAKELQSFLKGLKSSNDKWIATCANFLEMSYNFMEFRRAFRIGDAISIEYRYKKHSPVWECLKQHKYIDIFSS